MNPKKTDLEDKMDKIGNIDKIIHSTGRLKIVSLLYVIESADFVFLRGQTKLTWGNLSIQMKNLEEAGYLTIEKKFVHKKPLSVASLTNEGRKAFENYCQQMQEVLKII
jgi:DNA-binding MarR family transcriptional regulator